MFSAKRTSCHFLRRAKSNIKSTPEVCEPLDSGERFKALSEKILAKFSDGTSRNRFFAQNGGEKALNRCEVRVLQRKDLERRLKEQPYSLQTVGYGWVRMGDGGRKRVAWDGSKESFGQRKNFLFMEKVIFENSKERFVQKKSFWFAEKTDFSAHARPLGEKMLLLAKKVGVFNSCKANR